MKQYFREVYLFWVVCLASFVGTESLSLPGCPGKCGNLTIPFPFGMSSDCYFDDTFHIICNGSSELPRPFLRLLNAEVVSISLDGKLELLNSSSLAERDVGPVTMVVEWAAGDAACHIARSNNASRYACRSPHSQCLDSSTGLGHTCRCQAGYQGNPYLADGCQDTDACGGVSINLRKRIKCYSAKGLIGDGRKDGTHFNWFTVLPIIVLGIFVIVLMVRTWTERMKKQKKKLENLREDLFEKNGGNLLPRRNNLTIYTTEEMNTITNNYGDTSVMLGCTPGTFYRGTLSDGTTDVVVVKVDGVAESQRKHFVDQLSFLSQLHRNLVKVLGCCLEKKSPLIVYELHGDGNTTLCSLTRSNTRFSCEMRVQAAKGIARGLAHFNSHKLWARFVHGRICSANIMMNTFDPKIFYAAGSNLKNRATGQENDAYTDPKPLNKKSDVYSFGVVLVKLLTGEVNDRSMVANFVHMAEEDRLLEILDEEMTEMVGGRKVVKRIAREVAALAQRCLDAAPDRRPNMKKVSKKLTSLVNMG